VLFSPFAYELPDYSLLDQYREFRMNNGDGYFSTKNFKKLCRKENNAYICSPKTKATSYMTAIMTGKVAQKRYLKWI